MIARMEKIALTLLSNPKNTLEYMLMNATKAYSFSFALCTVLQSDRCEMETRGKGNQQSANMVGILYSTSLNVALLSFNSS